MPRSILLADDSVTIQKVIELTFMDEDYDVVSVSSGTAAIEKLGELRPDLVIADVHMPGASGYEVCRTAKRVYPDVPVLLLVGTFEPYDDNEAQAAGASSALKKPFDSQELLGTARALLASSVPASSVPAASALPVFDDPGAAFEPAPAPLGFEPGFGFEDALPPQPFPAPGAVETQLISNAEYTFDQLDSQAWATPSGGGDLDFGAGFGTSGMSPTIEEPDALDPIDLRTFAPAGP
jgi:CheY-like chemotaxis protein